MSIPTTPHAGRPAASGTAAGHAGRPAPAFPVAALIDGSPAPVVLRAWVAEHRALGTPPGDLQALLSRAIVLLDEALTRQVNVILHHRRFQALESAWRGLRYLVDQATTGAERVVLVRVLNVRWEELARDAERAMEFDHTTLFQKIYEEEFGLAGGQPFGVLIGDYSIHLRPSPEHPVDDLDVLRSISEAASAAFAPFLCGLHPSFLGLESFTQLERQPNLERMFQGAEYAKWRALRGAEDARFLGITLPNVLMRLPYGRSEAVAVTRRCWACRAVLTQYRRGQCPQCRRRFDPRAVGAWHTERAAFRFEEDVSGPGREKYLWGNAAFAFGGVLIRAFLDCRWLADIRGFDRDAAQGGIVTGLPVHGFGLDAPGVAPKMSTDVVIDDFQEKDFANEGLIPLCRCHDTEFAVFYSNRSVHRPQVYTDDRATVNARISSMLQYTLCIGRFAHYLKIQARDWIGTTKQPGELASRLRDWVNGYVTADDVAAPDVRAKYPLREADVQIRETPGRPGHYQMSMKLWPHYQLDDLLISVRFVTRIDGAGSPAAPPA